MNSNPRRLYRSADDRILAGVAGGVAAYFDIDPVIVRVIWFISIFFSGSLTFWAYLVMIIVVPLEPADWPSESTWAPGGAPVGSSGAAPGGWVATPPAPPADTAAGTGSGTSDAASTEPAATAAEPGAPSPGPNVAGFAAPAQPVQTGGDWRSRRDERWQRRSERWEKRAEREGRGPGLGFGLILILIGGLLAAHQIDPNFDLNITWPFVIIAVGGLLVASSVRVNRD